MKYIMFTSLVIALSSSFAFARQGENDQPGNGDDGRMIVCTNTNTQEVVLQFMSTQLQVQISTLDFDLLVKARGDDVAEMTIKDNRSGDSVRAKALEELLKVTLTTNEGTAPTVLETTTHRGAGRLLLVDAVTQDQVTVQSLSRRGVSQMEVNLVTNENPGKGLSLRCEKGR